MTIEDKKYYITTPIYYVNDKPHIGHAYTSLAVDIISRFKRKDGYKVKFLTGTDEHGQKVAKSARDKNISAEEFTNIVSQSFKDLASEMNFSNDDFIRTTEGRHKDSAKLFWKKLQDGGYIYKDKYSGWYSLRDEAFYQDEELVDGKAPSGADVQWLEEESYFFKLSSFQDKLLDFYKNNPDFIAPKSRYNEVLSFVRGGREYKKGALKDLSISRTSFNWGIEVPGDKDHVMYVWLDALVNYLSAVEYSTDGKQLQYWPADLHMVGKDILRFHAVYWPAFLMAAKIEIPKKIFAHGWWTNDGQKISKSIGNVIDPIILKEKFGLDQLRYFLMKQITFGSDGNYSDQLMMSLCNADLADNYGNLVQRVLSMVQKNCGGKIPRCDLFLKEDKKILSQGYELLSTLRDNIDNQNFSNYLNQVILLSSAANEYVNISEPWKLKKTNIDRMNHVLYVLLELIRIINIYLSPFIPDSTDKIFDLLSVSKTDRDFDKITSDQSLEPGINLPPPGIIFSKIIL